ncbi:MAG: S8 family serine peptidase [Bacteroidales bacterium]|nr:S8 family serine peptidase [Bacteroidales bacterium]
MNSSCLQADEKVVHGKLFLNPGNPGFMVLFLLIALPLRSQELYEQTAPETYRIEFNDKNGSPFTTGHPEAFLSSRAIARRNKQGIGIVYSDIPVSPAYIDSIRNTGVTIHNVSRWFNAVTFKTSDVEALSRIMNMSFVKRVLKSAPRQKSVTIPEIIYAKSVSNEHPALDYGLSLLQTAIHHGTVLHENGFTGEGIHIAVIDNGFFKVNELPVFSGLWTNGQILGARDFANRNSDIFEEESHGMKVLSIIGGILPGMLRGTATGASFWLLRSEDSGSEYIVEEDNWISAAEFADSAGVDIINTSLGYTTFDDLLQDHTIREIDGNSTRISRAADVAASKGMLVIISAGNQGQTSWKYISSPADADSILSVGAIDGSGRIAPFSGRGPSSDGRIKPEVVAVGKGTYYAGPDGGLWQGDGTSFSAPVVSGLAACLWQANPDASAMEIRGAILRSSHLYSVPDTTYGYGIPDFNLADLLLKADNASWELSERIIVFPNPFRDEIFIFFETTLHSGVEIDLFDLSGKAVLSDLYTGYEGLRYIKITRNLYALPKGIYIMRIVTDDFTDFYKIIKN